MHALHLQIVLRSPASFPASNASLSSGKSLPHVPGSALLGAVAADGRYLRLRRDGLASAVFHGGVRFGNGLPEGPGGLPAVPTPLCLHRPKGRRDGPVTNLAVAKDRPGGIEPVGGDFVAWNHGALVPVATPRRYSLRTATDGHGRPREGFMYGIEALAEGARFLARVDADDPALLAVVREALVEQPVLLGRSRGAELGEAWITEVAPWTFAQAEGSGATLLCLADVAPLDHATGAPSTDAADLVAELTAGGAPGWTVDWSRSFVRFREGGGYNAQHGTWRRSRLVIRAGSVIALEGRGPTAQLNAAAARGLGEWKELGLGQVLVSWDALATAELPWLEPVRAEAPEADRLLPAALAGDPLAAWVQRRHLSQGAEDEASKAGRHLGKVLFGQTPVKRQSKSQWRELERLCRRHAHAGPDAFVAEFTGYANHAVRKLGNAWGAEVNDVPRPGERHKLVDALCAWVRATHRVADPQRERGPGLNAVAALAVAANHVAEELAAAVVLAKLGGQDARS